jgi:homoserine kinase
MSRRVDVRVPGSMVQPDGVAIAANRWLRASFAFDALAPTKVGRRDPGDDVPGIPDTDWILEGFTTACAVVGRPAPDDLRIRAVSEIPLGADLGAAVAATVAGVVGARALLALALDDDAVVRIAGSVSGSADRTAASVAGHVCAIHPTCDDDLPPAA